MMGEGAKAASNGPGAADCPGTSDDLLSAREELAGELEKLSPKLRKTHKRLTKTAPTRGSQMAFWEQGLEDIQGHLDEVTFLLEECQRLLENEKREAARKAPAPSARRGVPQAKPDNLAKALERFDDAIILAFEKANAARSSLEMTDQGFSAGSRSSDFVKAAAQLKELAGFCEATAVQLRGPAALVRRPGAGQEESSGDERVS
jgi:hypothetical protein